MAPNNKIYIVEGLVANFEELKASIWIGLGKKTHERVTPDKGRKEEKGKKKERKRSRENWEAESEREKKGREEEGDGINLSPSLEVVGMRRAIGIGDPLVDMTIASIFSTTSTLPRIHKPILKPPPPPPKVSVAGHRLCRRHRPFSTTPAGGDEESEVEVKGSKLMLKDMRYNELEKWVQSYGYRPGQAMMLWKRLYGDNFWAHCPEELEGLNKEFHKMLCDNAEFKALHLKDVVTASDGTKKVLFTLKDGLVIETVVIPCDRGRTTVCVSSQVGCAMNCQFCYTGRMGLRRNLSAAEIVEQAVYARRLLSDEVGSITNVVFMGMGEPLHNVENVIKAADILVDDQGLHFSPRKVTISTSGLVPQLKRFLQESNCALAVSLNATTDEVRNWIMPVNRKYNLSLLLGTLKEELRSKHNYKVLFEYVMLAGVNDSIEDAKRLIDLVKDIPCKINLISFNPHSGSKFKPTKREKIIEFRNILAEAGCVVFFRLSRGDDQMAACGQLGKPGEIQAPLLRVPPQFEAALEASVVL